MPILRAAATPSPNHRSSITLHTSPGVRMAGRLRAGPWGFRTGDPLVPAPGGNELPVVSPLTGSGGRRQGWGRPSPCPRSMAGVQTAILVPDRDHPLALVASRHQDRLPPRKLALASAHCDSRVTAHLCRPSCEHGCRIRCRSGYRHRGDHSGHRRPAGPRGACRPARRRSLRC